MLIQANLHAYEHRKIVGGSILGNLHKVTGKAKDVLWKAIRPPYCGFDPKARQMEIYGVNVAKNSIKAWKEAFKD